MASFLSIANFSPPRVNNCKSCSIFGVVANLHPLEDPCVWGQPGAVFSKSNLTAAGILSLALTQYELHGLTASITEMKDPFFFRDRNS